MPRVSWLQMENDPIVGLDGASWLGGAKSMCLLVPASLRPDVQVNLFQGCLQRSVLPHRPPHSRVSSQRGDTPPQQPGTDEGDQSRHHRACEEVVSKLLSVTSALLCPSEGSFLTQGTCMGKKRGFSRARALKDLG